MTVKLIALDMDGTLLNPDETISQVNHETITRALEKNVQVVLSTGRSYDTCYSYAKSLNLTSYLITCNGGEIWTVGRELIERHLLRPERVREMWKRAEHLDLNTWMISTDRIWRGVCPDDFFRHDWLKFGCDSDDYAVLAKFIEELSYYDDLELANSLPTNIEVNPKGVHKASALESVCSRLNLELNNVLAIGDSLNDMKMIQEAGLGIAMGNAQEAIKNVADDVTAANDQHGVSRAIEKFVLTD